MVIACPAPRTTFRWLPCHCWLPHPPATRVPWPLSSLAPTRPMQPSCAHRRAQVSAGRSGVRHAPRKHPVPVQLWPHLGGDTASQLCHLLTQVVLIGDGVGGILGFDALCHSASAGTGSRGSSRRGSMVSVAKPSLLRRGDVSISRSLPPWNVVSLHVGRAPAAKLSLLWYSARSNPKPVCSLPNSRGI